jgi:hypothetical protein
MPLRRELLATVIIRAFSFYLKLSKAEGPLKEKAE